MRVIDILNFVIMWLNNVPIERLIYTTLSPRVIMLGANIDFKTSAGYFLDNTANYVNSPT